jgi:uncharacterized protein (DUF1501 family)
MKRRDFLRGAASVGLPLAFGGYSARALGLSPALEKIAELAAIADRYLVLIQLGGGNDGINTVVPLDQMSDYNRLRSNIALPENRILKLTDAVGLHPAMPGMKALFDAGNLAIVQGVAYPGSNFSHFRSTDIWLSASDFDQYVNTGWLGRYLDRAFPNYPVGFPSESMPDPLAIQISATPSLVLRGPSVQMGVNVQDPDAFYRLVSGSAVNGFDSEPDNAAGRQIAYIRQVQAQSEVYAGVIKKANDRAKNLAAYTPRGINPLADQLAIVARLIAGGLQTRVYLATLGGFDTHAQQVVASDRTLGSHATLLARLSEGVASFQEDMKLMKLQDKVVGMTFSEFGRRVQSNVSAGTDHGTSAPMFVFGAAVKGGIIGANPSLTNLTNGNLQMQYDFRQVYATVLRQWFGVNDADYNATLSKNFAALPLFHGSAAVATSVCEERAPLALRIQNYPNPVAGVTRFEYALPFASRVRLTVLDAQGRAVSSMEEMQSAGAYSVQFDASSLAPGAYHYRLETERGWTSGVMMVNR